MMGPRQARMVQISQTFLETLKQTATTIITNYDVALLLFDVLEAIY